MFTKKPGSRTDKKVWNPPEEELVKMGFVRNGTSFIHHFVSLCADNGSFFGKVEFSFFIGNSDFGSLCKVYPENAKDVLNLIEYLTYYKIEDGEAT